MYADVISADEVATLLTALSGSLKERMETSFIIFKNVSKSYLTRNVDYDFPEIYYRSSPKAWIDSSLFMKYLKENQTFKQLSSDRTRIIFIDICNAQKLTTDLVKELELSCTGNPVFSMCTTHLLQPVDAFVILSIKAMWMKKWNENHVPKIELKMWADPHPKPRLLFKPGKPFSLKLAADAV